MHGYSQRDTPLFHGMKSSWSSSSAFVFRPLATRSMSSRRASDDSSGVDRPEMMGPQSKSMMSGMRWLSAVLVEILITGAIGFPVGVPNPVVNMTMLAPEPTCAVTASTSLPGEQSKLRPDCVAYSG